MAAQYQKLSSLVETKLNSFCRVCVLVLLPIPNCEAGHVQPIFLYRTPSHGDILHATVGQTFQLYAEAEARHSRCLLTEIINYSTSFP